MAKKSCYSCANRHTCRIADVLTREGWTISRTQFRKACIELAEGCDSYEKPGYEPCPFCGEYMGLVMDVHNNDWTVLCANCDANGPIRPTSEEAEKAWDRRPSDSVNNGA